MTHIVAAVHPSRKGSANKERKASAYASIMNKKYPNSGRRPKYMNDPWRYMTPPEDEINYLEPVRAERYQKSYSDKQALKKAKSDWKVTQLSLHPSKRSQLFKL